MYMHGHLGLQVRRGALGRVAAVVRACMEGAVPLNGVPLAVTLKAGAAWGALEPYAPASE